MTQRKTSSRSDTRTPEASQPATQATKGGNTGTSKMALMVENTYQIIKELEKKREEDRKKIAQIGEVVARLLEKLQQGHVEQKEIHQKTQASIEKREKEHAKRIETLSKEHANQINELTRTLTQEREALKTEVKAMVDMVDTRLSKIQTTPSGTPSYANVACTPPYSQPSNLQTVSTHTTSTTPTNTLYCTVDTSRVEEEDREKAQLRKIRQTIETELRTTEGKENWRCMAVQLSSSSVLCGKPS
ncbi:uncharacterized protein BDZ99DRAFT_118734 [Mytilinidion resinicola]|uniref:Uncharacterized protein n=1 Tax=Mytilinidion resinicola TaxID=574789 RepID=A0A6A6Z336_9PEZI|nr:uncharacterized protein BDZ99DRAFT_118734 [Mytilinidion resinicola]KAF2815582.1 hypothetical protein BDZ99DRAFT_118734 [Mytilinidion resinicola]